MPKTSPINMRVEPSQHALLTKAAAALNLDRSTFILDVACREAENVLLNQRFFQLSDSAFTDFEKAITQAVPVNSKLKSLLNSVSPWDK